MWSNEFVKLLGLGTGLLRTFNKSVLVIYDCVTTCPKISGLKHQPFYNIYNFVAGNLSRAQPSCSSVTLGLDWGLLSGLLMPGWWLEKCTQQNSASSTKHSLRASPYGLTSGVILGWRDFLMNTQSFNKEGSKKQEWKLSNF